MNNELLAHVANTFNETVGSLSTDLLTFLVIFLVFYSVGVFIGRARLSSLMLSLYPAAIIFLTFPYTYNLTFIRGVKNNNEWSAFLVFLFFLIICFTLISRLIHTGEWHGLKRWLYTALFAFFGVFQTIAMGYNVLPFSKLIMLTTGWHSFFHTPIVNFAFLLAPLAAVYILRRY